MADLFVAIGLVLAIEGALYALFPEQMKSMMRFALERAPGELRTAGLAAAVAGVFLVWLVRG